MQNGGIVYFKATKNNIIVMLDPQADFAQIKEALEFKATDARKFFGKNTAYIIFRGRNLSKVQEKELVEIIEKQTELNVYVVEDTAKNAAPPVIPFEKRVERAKAENDDKLAPSAKERAAKAERAVKAERTIRPSAETKEAIERMPVAYAQTLFNQDNDKSVFHKGSLRSGMCIECEGSVVILGDVNPGGEIIAGGNIVVLGSLKGLAHAGAYGDKDTYVAAISLQPVQLRIANIITTVAEEKPKGRKSAEAKPSYAYIHDDKIYIAPLA